MPRRMTDFLDEAVKTHPDKVAFTEEERSLTYKELQGEGLQNCNANYQSWISQKTSGPLF